MKDELKLKQAKADLDAANAEARHYLDRISFLEEENRKLISDKTLLMWQMDIIRTTLSRVVQA